MSGAGGLSPAEQHLGEALAALVDGELRHDARDRVLAHLATCPRCKAEADAQRRLKSVFSATAPPPPSDGLLARLEGLPGVDLDDPGGNPFRRDDGRGDGRDGRGAGAKTASRSNGRNGSNGRTRAGIALIQAAPLRSSANGNGNGNVTAAAAAAAAAVQLDAGRGFRIHEVDRPAARGRRFAFAAAGAVSFAALALGGALPIETAVDPGGGSPAVTPGDRGGAVRPATSGGAQDAGEGGPGGDGGRQEPLVQPAPGARAESAGAAQPPLLSVVSVTEQPAEEPLTRRAAQHPPQHPPQQPSQPPTQPPRQAPQPLLSGTNAPNLR